MSITLATLAADATIIREIFPDVFTLAKFNATALVNLKKTIALDELKQDLYSEFRINPSDSSDLTELDEIVDKYSIQLQRALMYLQCYYYFVENDDVEGKNAERKRMCWQKYNSLKTEWRNFVTDNRITTTLGTIIRG